MYTYRMKKLNEFDRAAGTANHGMYAPFSHMQGVGTISKPKPSPLGVAKKVVKAVVGAPMKVVDTYIEKSKAVDAARVERNTKLLKAQGMTWDDYNELNKPKKKGK